jgi:hypothetical protein
VRRLELHGERRAVEGAAPGAQSVRQHELVLAAVDGRVAAGGRTWFRPAPASGSELVVTSGPALGSVTRGPPEWAMAAEDCAARPRRAPGPLSQAMAQCAPAVPRTEGAPFEEGAPPEEGEPGRTALVPEWDLRGGVRRSARPEGRAPSRACQCLLRSPLISPRRRQASRARRTMRVVGGVMVKDRSSS